MIIDEEAFLEHYGTKGMRWGQRRAKRKQTLASMTKEQRVAYEQKREERNANIAAGIYTGVGLAAVGARFLLSPSAQSFMSRKAKDINTRKATKAGSGFVKNFIDVKYTVANTNRNSGSLRLLELTR